MRFKIAMNEPALLLMIATYVVYLWGRGQLGLYIHPRYIVFTFAFGLLALLVLLYRVARSASEASVADSHSHRRIIGPSLLPLMVMVLLAILLPARSLTSSTASQRLSDAGTAISTGESQPITALFAGSSKGLSVADWSRTLAANRDPDFYLNKPAAISGFVFDAGLGEDYVWVSRFILTCCAVDAQPVGVPVHIPGWAEQFEQDQWLEVEGSFELQETAKGPQIVLIPESVEQIEEPSDPYAN